MSGFVLAVVILVLALGGVTWFLISRNSRKSLSNSTKGQASPARAVTATESGAAVSNEAAAESDGATAAEDPEDGYADEEDDDLPWRQKVARADEKKDAGDYDVAIDMYEEALEKAREELGRDSVEVAEILLKQGAAYQARDDDEDDEETVPACYPRALSILEQRFGVFDSRLLPALNHLASFFDQTGRHHDAETLTRRVEDIMSRTRRNRQMACAAPEVDGANDTGEVTQPTVTVPPINMQVAQPLANTAVAVATVGTTDGAPCSEDADAHMLRFEYDDAIEAYESTLEQARESHGRDSLVLVPILMGLGKAYQDRDDDEDSDCRDNYPDNFYLRALAIVEQKRGAFAGQLIPIMVRLVSYYDEIGEHNKAESMIRRIDSIERFIAAQE